MKYQIFSDNEWVYPDTKIETANTAVLFSARNADVCFQLLTDYTVEAGEAFSVSADEMPSDCEAVVYQLMEAHVGENSDRKMLTTKDYESVRDFVTRRAPFDVYDITRSLEDGTLYAGRAAFFVRLNVGADAKPGEYTFSLTLTLGAEQLTIPVSLKIYTVKIPALSAANFHMINWIYYGRVAKDHGVELRSPEYMAQIRAYMDNQLDMRNDYLMIPSGVPVRDENGRVVDFDFSHAEEIGNLALEKGFTYIMGGFVARFVQWDDPDDYLLWDREIGVTTLEGFRQLRIYFKRAWECVCRNNWQKQYMQCLVDEPQFPNSLAYRALSGICRQRMPGVIINDPVETTDIEGAVDVWVVKQATYEQYIDTYRALQEMGEEMWLYTCGFPGGYVMNRVIDLPLTVSRLPMWMCYLYDAKGFLHWGYHVHNPEYEKETCYRVPEGCYPAGNAHVVYPAKHGPDYGVRAHAQRSGAIDAELFCLLGQREGGKEEAKALIRRVCRSFSDYDPSSALFDSVRHELLELLG